MARTNNLTEHELSILRLTAKGLFYKDIALELSISVSTVRNELCIIRRKLNAYNSSHAVAIAMARGLIKPEEVVVHD